MISTLIILLPTLRLVLLSSVTLRHFKDVYWDHLGLKTFCTTHRNIYLLCTFWQPQPDIADTPHVHTFLRSLLFIKSCVTLAVFSSALVAVSWGPHNSSMHHWPPVNHTVSEWQYRTPHHYSSVTHRLSLHDGLHSGLWWIIRLALRGKHTNTPWLRCINRQWLTVLCFTAGWHHIFVFLLAAVRANSVSWSPSLFYLSKHKCLLLSVHSG